VAALRRAGGTVTLMAPQSGRVLEGDGPADVHRLLDWDSAATAGLFTPEGPATSDLHGALSGIDLAIAYTRNADLIRNLARVVPRVLAHDPLPAGESEHAASWLARPLASLGLAADALLPPCTPSPGEAEHARNVQGDLERGFLAVHPGSGSVEKRWPAERFAALVRTLAAARPWLLVEGPADAASVRPLEGIPGLRLARSLPTRVLGTLLASAGLLVANDSGVSHLAAAWGAPTLALFGPTNPAVWAPQGPRVHVVRSPTPSMDAIPLEQVLAECDLMNAAYAAP
jgi:heptosyltransferase-2